VCPPQVYPKRVQVLTRLEVVHDLPVQDMLPSSSCNSVYSFSAVYPPQVYPKGVQVLRGLEEVQDLPIQDILPSTEWRPQVVIAAACIADPYLLLHFSDGSAVLLSGDEEEGNGKIIKNLTFFRTQVSATMSHAPQLLLSTHELQ